MEILEDNEFPDQYERLRIRRNGDFQVVVAKIEVQLVAQWDKLHFAYDQSRKKDNINV